MGTRRNRIAAFVTTASGVIGISVMGIALAMVVNYQPGEIVGKSRSVTMEQELDALKNQVAELGEFSKRFVSDLDSVAAMVEQAAENPEGLDSAKMAGELSQLRSNIRTIETALGSDLERSLSVPLFRKDIEQLRDQLKERTTMTSKEIDRIYDQNKWFLGLMGTMAIGLLGLAVSSLLQARKKGDS